MNDTFLGDNGGKASVQSGAVSHRALTANQPAAASGEFAAALRVTHGTTEELRVQAEHLTFTLEKIRTTNAQVRDQSHQLVVAFKEARAATGELRSRAASRPSADSLEHGPEALLVTDRLGRISQANRAAALLFRIPQSQLRDKPLSDFIPRGSRGDFRRLMTHLREPSQNMAWEFILKPAAASSLPVAVTVSVDRDAATHRIELRWQLWDASAHWHAEKRIRDLARSAVLFQEQDRQRVSNVLYEEIGQVLSALRIQLLQVHETLPAELAISRDELDHISSLLSHTIAEVDSLAGELRPPQLDLLGLDATLREYCERFARAKQLTVEYAGAPLEHLTDSGRILLFRFLEEALELATRSERTHHLRVSLNQEHHQVTLSVQVDIYKRTDHVLNAQALEAKGTPAGRRETNLVRIYERLELLGGALEIHESAGSASCITARLPS